MSLHLHRNFSHAHDGDAVGLSSCGLWSMWDMLRENATDFMKLGQVLYDLRLHSIGTHTPNDQKSGIRKLVPVAVDEVQTKLRKILAIARRLNLQTSIGILERQIQFADSCPQTEREINIIRDIFESELSSRKCLFITSHLDKYYENESIVNDAVLLAFPTASEEMRNAGTCLAVSMHTASVFHSMRAAEIGLRSMNLRSHLP